MGQVKIDDYFIKPLPAYAGRVICWCVTLDVLNHYRLMPVELSAGV